MAAGLTVDIRGIIKMPTIPFQTAQSMLPVNTRGGQVSQWDTGMPQYGGGMEVLAEQLNTFQQQKDTAEANRQLSNAETALATTWGGIKDKWENGIKNWDENLPKIAQDDLDNLKKVGDSITNEKARLAFQDTSARAQAGAQVELNGYQNKLQINQGIADSSARLDAFKQLRPKTNNPDEKKGIDQLVITQINRDKEGGILNPVQAQKLTEEYQQFARNDDVISEIYNMRNQYGDEATLAKLNNPNVHRELANMSSEATVDNLHATLAASINWKDHQIAEEKRLKAEAQDRNYRSELVKFYSGEMNPNETLSLMAMDKIKPEQGRQLLNDFQSKVKEEKTEKTAEQKKELEDISYLNYSQLLPKVRQAVSTGRKEDIDAMQNTITEEFRKNEISDTHAKQLTDALYSAGDPKDPINDPRVKDKLGTLEKLHTAGIFGEKGTREAAIAYSKKHDDMVDYIRSNPKATTKDIEDHFEGLIKDDKKGFWMKTVNFFLAAQGKLPLPSEQKASPPTGTAQTPNYGLRTDGTPKGKGFLGELQRPDGRVSTEISVGVSFNGQQMDIPTLVPTLNQEEIDYLLKTPLKPEMFKTPIGKVIMQKAIDHAKKRISEEKSPFAQEGEQKIDPEREKAIKFLKDNGKVVNEETIKMVIGKVE
jgi:hypothetical protein